MRFYVLTLFPEMVEGGMRTSITGRAIDKGLLSLETMNIRDYAQNKHKKVDDYTYGGGAGMLMQAEPVYLAWQAACDRIGRQADPVYAPSLPSGTGESCETAPESQIKKDNRWPRTVYLTPVGRTFTQEMAVDLAQEEDLVFLCGHYEGIDERVIEEIVTDPVSIGDYVLTGGELAAMVMMDAIARMVPGVLSNAQSGETESFQGHLLEYPQYSRPEEWRGKRVPEVLLSGHHANVDAWRRSQSLYRTWAYRPDLLKKADLTEKEWAMIRAWNRAQKDGAPAEPCLTLG